MNPRSTGSLLLLALLSCSGGSDTDSGVTAVIPRWINLQRLPTSAHLRTVRFANAQQGIIAGDATSIFRTNDGGATWFQEEHEPFALGGNIASFDLMDGDYVLVGSNPAGDAGRFWSSSNAVNWVSNDSPGAPASPFISADLVAGPTNQPNIAWFLRANGMVRVRQGNNVGEADTDFDAYPVPQTVRALDATTDGIAGVVGTAGKFKQVTLGSSTWDDTPTPTSENLNAIQYVDSSTWFIAGENGTVLFRQPFQSMFVLPGNLDSRDLYAIHCPTSPHHAWAVGESGCIVKVTGLADSVTGDFSFTFETKTSGTTQHLRDVWFIPAADPDDEPQIGYAVGDNGTILKTTNGGDSWFNPVPNPGATTTILAVDFVQAGDRGLAVGEGGTVLRTLDGGFNWTSIAGGISGSQIIRWVSIKRMGARDEAMICGDGGFVRRNDDVWGSGTWTAGTAPPVIVDFYAIVWWAENGVFMVGDNGTILRCSNPNTTPFSWTSQPYFGGTSNLRTVQVAETFGFAGGTNGVLVGVDMASLAPNDWNLIVDVGAATILSLDAPTSAAAYLVCSDNVFRRALLPTGVVPYFESGGTPPGVTTMNAVSAFSANLFLVGNGIWTSNNGGDTWTPSPDHTTDLLHAVWRHSPNGEVGFAAGANGTILLTTTGGD